MTRFLTELKAEIQDYAPYESLEVQQANILLIGQVGVGKSSFFNTINSAYKGHVASQAVTGRSQHSITKTVRVGDYVLSYK